MQCPRCSRPTVIRDYHGTRVNCCEQCNGMFLHRGELNKVEPTQGDLEFSTLHEESFRHEDGFAPIDCPDCGAPHMKKVEFNIYTGIVLDYCASCGGFWLDGPELERIDVEVRKLNEASTDVKEPPMMWFARFIWSLPR